MKFIQGFVCFAAFSVMAFAVDGVVLINQATVLAAGGFPYTIGQPGSYRLAGNLQSTNTSAIVIVAPNVTLDLNGFSVSCTQCSGVAGIQSAVSLTTILNGNVYGFGGSSGSPYGIYIATGDAKIDRVSVFGNGTGLYSNGDISVTNSSFINNSRYGIYCAGVLLGSQLKVAGNSTVGISMDSGTLTGSNISSNGSQGGAGAAGVSAYRATITGNLFRDNFGSHIVDIAGGAGELIYGLNTFVGTATAATGDVISLGNNVCHVLSTTLC